MTPDTPKNENSEKNKEGGLCAPKRHAVPFEDPLYYDEADFEKELRRVSDICHTCRRCFNLCKTFPKLFDAFDGSKTGEVDSLKRQDFQPAIDACTLCDMCFMVKCPYVPPHPFNIDFPKLMLRARAIEARKKGVGFAKNQITKTDRNGKLGCLVSGVANWTTKRGNKTTRPLMEKVTGIDKNADLPKFAKGTFQKNIVKPPVNREGPGFGEKVILYTTCFVNYHNKGIGEAALKVLAHNGVESEIFYPGCCGMPRLEQGQVKEVANKAKQLAEKMYAFVTSGVSIITLVPSCTLMMTHEWPLLWPKNSVVKAVSENVKDITTFLVDLAKRKGLAKGLKTIKGDVYVHIPCHARAQNKGRQAEMLLRHLPETSLDVLEKCSGHGGTWGIFKDNFQDALSVGKPVMRRIASKKEEGYVVSECPLAAAHLQQGTEILTKKEGRCSEKSTSSSGKQLSCGGCKGGINTELVAAGKAFLHPIELMAHAWGLYS